MYKLYECQNEMNRVPIFPFGSVCSYWCSTVCQSPAVTSPVEDLLFVWLAIEPWMSKMQTSTEPYKQGGGDFVLIGQWLISTSFVYSDTWSLMNFRWTMEPSHRGRQADTSQEYWWTFGENSPCLCPCFSSALILNWPKPQMTSPLRCSCYLYNICNVLGYYWDLSVALLPLLGCLVYHISHNLVKFPLYTVWCLAAGH